MPITGTPTPPPAGQSVLTKDDIRMFLRDRAPNNILLDDVQFTDAELDRALDFTVDEWNTINPITNDVAGGIPKSLLMMGVCGWLMMSESFLQIRNQATVQDGDIAPVGIDDKHQLYLSLSRQLREEWKTAARGVKMQRNMESGYNSVSSGYANIGRYQ